MTDTTKDRTRDRVLMMLKSRGALSTAVLARLLGITIPGVRQHLKTLAEEGLVQQRTLRQGVGRPAHEWMLTAVGHHRFPDTHAEMTVTLIDSIRDTLGEKALDQVIEHRHRQTVARYQRALAPIRTLEEKLAQIAALRTEEGYMAEVSPLASGGWLLAENHCPICAAATHCQGFCRSELELFRTVLGEDVAVQRIEYLLDDARRCAYQITSRPS